MPSNRDSLVKEALIPKELILGTAQRVSGYGWSKSYPTPRREFRNLLTLAEKIGISAIDTAQVYGDAEAQIGAAEVVLPIHTKTHFRISIGESVKKSLQSLRRNRLDLLYLHDRFTGNEVQLATLKRLQDEFGGIVKQVGVSIYEVSEFLMAIQIPEIDVIQVPFNVLDRRFGTSKILENVNGKRIIARSIFLQGILTSTPRNLSALPEPLIKPVRHFQEICNSHGFSPGAGAMAWVRAQGAFAGIIIGASTVDELLDSKRQFSLPVSASLIEDLEGLETPPWQLVDPRKW